jgi:protein involved in polysaccharide export with SLBB domain
VIVDAELGDLLDLKRRTGESKPVVDDPLIQDRDFVRISTVPSQVENIVSLTGAVRDSGPYEFRPGMRLRDLLTPEQMLIDSYWDRAELVRVDPRNYEPTVLSFSPRELFTGIEGSNLELRRLDRVVVYTQVQAPRMVSVKGEIKRPGNYTISTAERLSSVLRRTGGLTPRAFPRGIIIIRESVRRAQQSEVEKFVLLQKQTLISESAATAQGLMSIAAPGLGMGSGGSNAITETLRMQLAALDQLTLRLQPGRVVIKMESVDSVEGTSEDIALEDGDQITMPEQPRTVTILGAVRNPTSVVHEASLRPEDYVRKAGGVTPDGSLKEAYILRADGTTESSYVNVKEVMVGDTVVVPIRVEPKVQPLPFWASIFTALSGLASVATAAAALVVLGRQ